MRVRSVDGRYSERTVVVLVPTERVRCRTNELCSEIVRGQGGRDSDGATKLVKFLGLLAQSRNAAVVGQILNIHLAAQTLSHLTAHFITSILVSCS